MVDVDEIFYKRLQDIRNNLDNYSIAEKIAHDLVTFSWSLDNPNKVFISEILENVFGNLDELSSYDMSEEIKKTLKTTIASKMDSFLKTYKSSDPLTMYQSLEQLRYITTFHQVDIWQKYSKLTVRGRVRYSQ